MSSPITCHVLNTVSGTPASNLKSTLTLLSRSTTGLQPGLSFPAVTNEDGRVKDWEAAEDGTTLQSIMEKYGQGDKIACSIKFEIGSWYEERGVESFWPEVEIKFYVKKGERHYHVPCLVGKYTFENPYRFDRYKRSTQYSFTNLMQGHGPIPRTVDLECRISLTPCKKFQAAVAFAFLCVPIPRYWILEAASLL